MLRFLLLLIFVWVIARSLRRLVGGVADGLAGGARADVGATNLVRDPVCGTFVVPARALSAGAGSGMRFFCSEKCRQAWAKR